MKSPYAPRPTIVPDPVLGPLLERLAVLESANYRLKSGLSERSFNVEVDNAALSERLARAKEEIARHQGMLENVCSELLVAVQTRDRAQAAADESLKVRSELISQRDGLRLQLDDALKAGAQAQAAADENSKARSELSAQCGALRSQLDGALKANSDAEARNAQSRRTLAEVIGASQAAAGESLKAHSELAAQRDGLRLQLDDLLKAAAAAEARGAQIRRGLEEYSHAAQAAAEESFRVRAETAAQRDGLRLQLDDALKAGAQAQAAANESLKVGVEYPSMEYALEPGWARLLGLVRPPLLAAYGHLRRLSSGTMSAGSRAILRMTGSSLSQASDALATIELALVDSPATTAAAPVLPVLEAALAAWEAVLRRRGIALTREFSRTVPDSPHDPEQLRLALHHVLRNAVEGLPRGSTLRVALDKTASDSVRLVFRDDGPGYPTAWLARRFEPFVSPRPGHAGLGLAAVSRALNRWGGNAAAANGANGRGACLTLTFAPAPAEPATNK